MKPLRDNLSIDYFTYCKYSSGRCDLTSSDKFAAVTYLADKGSILPLEVNNSNTVLDWQEYCSKSYHDFITERYNNSSDGITFVLRHYNNKAEHISLHTTGERKKRLIDKMYSQKRIMHDVVAHIRNHINFNRDDFESLSFKKKLSGNDNLKIINKNEFDNIHNREYIYGLNGPTYITRSEKRCLVLLLKMKTSREIAKDINTAVRTVECHIASLRKKLGAKKRHDLFLICKNNFIFPFELT